MPQPPRTPILQHIRRLTAAHAAEHLSDGDLLQRFTAARDEAAFAALVERHGAVVLGVCRRVLRHQQDVEDAFQATFLVLARHARSIRRHDSLGGWLYRVAFRVAVRARARAARLRAREAPLEDVPAPASGDDVTWRELRGILDEELNRLPERYRAPIVLCCLQGLSRDEAAQELGWTAGMLKGRLERGREVLRGRLARRGLSLSAALFAALLGRTASAAVPALLSVAAVRTAVSAASAEAIPAGVAALADGLLRTTLALRPQLAGVLLLALTFLAGAAGLFVPQPPAPPAAGAAQAPAPAQPGPKEPQRREGFDLHGDPLPDGALARLGTVRLRHGERIYSVAVPRDGSLVAAADASGEVVLWDPVTGEARHRLRHGRSAFSVALSPDGKLVAAGGLAEVGVGVWDTATGKQLHRLGAGTDGSMAVTFSPDGKTLVAGGHDHKVRLWDVGQGVEVRTLTGHTGPVYAVAVSPDGKTVASGSTDKTIRLWDAATGRERLKLEGHRERVLGLSFPPDGKRLASCGMDVTVRLWDTATGAALGQFRGVQWDNWIYGVAFTADGKSLVTSGHFDGAVRVWDAVTLKETRRFKARQHDDAVLALSADGKLLATGGQNAVVRLWDFATGRERLAGRGPEAGVTALAFSPDGRTLATGGHNEPITLWGLSDGRARRAGDGKRIATRFVVFSPDGKGLVSTDIALKLYEWDAVTEKEVRVLRGPESHLMAACFTEWGLLAAGAHADQIDLWEVRTDRRRRLTHAGPKPTVVSYLALSPDGKTLASSGGGTIRFWETASGKETASFAASAGHLTFSPDGRTLAFSDYAAVRLWDVATRKVVRTLPGDNQAVMALAFSRDSRLLASTGVDPRVNLWEVATGREIRRFNGHTGWVQALAFSPDGRVLASGGRDTTAVLWDVTGRVKGGKMVAANPTPAELEALWTALRDEAPARAFPALWALVAAPKQSVPFLGRRLPAAAAADRRIPQWIADLGDDRFAVREKAMKGLAEQGARAALPLRQALKGGLTEEARRRIEALLAKAPGTVSDGLAVMRAVHVLEQIGTAEARAVLREVAEAGGETPAGREARASLRRLEKGGRRR